MDQQDLPSVTLTGPEAIRLYELLDCLRFAAEDEHGEMSDKKRLVFNAFAAKVTPIRDRARALAALETHRREVARLEKELGL